MTGTGGTSGSRLPHLLASVLLLGIADSMIGPYLVLFGADEAHLSPLQVACSCRSSPSAALPSAPG